MALPGAVRWMKKTTLVRIRMFETVWGRALIQNISQQRSIPIVVVHNDANFKIISNRSIHRRQVYIMFPHILYQNVWIITHQTSIFEYNIIISFTEEKSIIIQSYDPKIIPLYRTMTSKSYHRTVPWPQNRTIVPYPDFKTVPSYRTMTSKPYPPTVPRSKHPNSHLLWKFIKNTFHPGWP